MLATLSIETFRKIIEATQFPVLLHNMAARDKERKKMMQDYADMIDRMRKRVSLLFQMIS